MKKCQITVVDEDYHVGGIMQQIEDEKNGITEPHLYQVEAWCVDGDEGIYAFFYLPNRPDQKDILWEAAGDDGNWWVIGAFHVAWVGEIIEALQAAQKGSTFAGFPKGKMVEIVGG